MDASVSMLLFWSVVGTLAGGGFGLYFKSSAGRERLHDRIDTVEKQIAEFKLDVANRYATITYLKDVELRLANALRGLEDTMKSIDATLDTLARAFARAEGERGRPPSVATGE